MKDTIKELEEISARLKKAAEEVKTSHKNAGFLYNEIEVPVVDAEQFSKPWREQKDPKVNEFDRLYNESLIRFKLSNPISNYTKETKRRKYYQKLWKKKARSKKETDLENKILKEKLQDKERQIEELNLRMNTIKRNLTQTIMFADNRINHK